MGAKMPCTKEKIKHKAKNIDTCTYIKYNIFMKKKGIFVWQDSRITGISARLKALLQ